MIDFHSHIAPAIDDGSVDVKMSLEMLKESVRCGVTDVLSTSHCYPKSNESIARFLQRRDDALLLVRQAMENEGMQAPKIHLGCEVNMYMDIAKLKYLPKLCIENTNYIMIEMPYEPWKEWMLECIYKMTIQGLRPILAHIDRFIKQDKGALNSLFELDVLYQVNTELFTEKHMNKFADMLLTEGHAHVIGTDMHNMTTRKPNMDKTYDKIVKRYGEECMEYFTNNAKKILNNEAITDLYYKLPEKKSFFDRVLKK